MSEITAVSGRTILDSRGLPTVECTLKAKIDGKEQEFTAAVPSGASTGTKEACEKRDGGNAFLGKGVQKAVDNVNKVIGPRLIEEKKLSVVDQSAIDKILIDLDGTPNKTELGANAILAVSQAVCRAGAAKKGISLYKHIADLCGNKHTDLSIPNMFFNVINGGKHASNLLACQEIMFTVLNTPEPSKVLQKASETFHTLKAILKEKKETTNVGDEGGFAPNVTPAEGIELIIQAATKLGYENDIKIGFDFAASEFETKENSKEYDLDFKATSPVEKHHIKNKDAMLQYYVDLMKKYPQIISIEDPFSEFDTEGYADLLKAIKDKKLNCQIVADDLTVTNPKIIKECIDKKAANALLVKMNQIGSVSEAIDASKLALDNGWTLMVSHRSGETTDTFVADFSVGVCAQSVKFGAPSRGERVAKYNSLVKYGDEMKLKMNTHKFI